MLTPVGRNRRPVFRRPAILMSRVPAVAGEGRTILHEEGQPVLFGDFQVINALREHSLIEFTQPQCLGAALPDGNLAHGSLDRAAVSDLLLPLAPADPIRDVAPSAGVRVPIVDSTVWAPDLPAEAGQVQGLVCPWPESLSAVHLLLDIIEGLLVNDGLVCPFDIILGQLTAVLPALLGDRVGNILFLKQQAAGIGHIRKNHLDVGIHPAASLGCGDAFRCKLALSLQPRLSLQEVLKDAANDCGFIRLNHQMITFPAVPVHMKAPIGHALLKPLAQPPFDVFTQRTHLFLCKGCHDGNEQLAFIRQRIDAFLFKADLDAQLLQPADNVERVHCVSGKA